MVEPSEGNDEAVQAELFGSIANVYLYLVTFIYTGFT